MPGSRRGRTSLNLARAAEADHVEADTGRVGVVTLDIASALPRLQASCCNDHPVSEQHGDERTG